MNFLVLLVWAVLPIFFIGMYLYNKDPNKEPTKLLVKLFIGGVLSTIITFLITGIFELLIPELYSESMKSNLIGLLFYVFIGIALIEEVSKWIIVYKISYNNKEFDEFYDIILYATFVALGFACFENLLYVLQSGLTTAMIRAITAVPGHVFDGVFMGYYLGIAKINYLNGRDKFYKKNILLSILAPIAIHGIYDYLVFAFVLTKKGIYVLLLLALVIFMYIYCIKRIMKVSKLTGKFNSNNINENNN